MSDEQPCVEYEEMDVTTNSKYGYGLSLVSNFISAFVELYKQKDPAIIPKELSMLICDYHNDETTHKTFIEIRDLKWIKKEIWSSTPIQAVDTINNKLQGFLQIIDEQNLRAVLSQENISIIHDSTMNIYADSMSEYAPRFHYVCHDVTAVLTDKRIYFIQSKYCALWAFFKLKSNIDDIVDDTTTIDRNIATQIAKNIIFDEELMEARIIHCLVGLKKMTVLLSVLLCKMKISSLLSLFGYAISEPNDSNTVPLLWKILSTNRGNVFIKTFAWNTTDDISHQYLNLDDVIIKKSEDGFIVTDCENQQRYISCKLQNDDERDHWIEMLGNRIVHENENEAKESVSIQLGENESKGKDHKSDNSQRDKSNCVLL